jgi:hypothetical protein
VIFIRVRDVGIPQGRDGGLTRRLLTNRKATSYGEGAALASVKRRFFALQRYFFRIRTGFWNNLAYLFI